MPPRARPWGPTPDPRRPPASGPRRRISPAAPAQAFPQPFLGGRPGTGREAGRWQPKPQQAPASSSKTAPEATMGGCREISGWKEGLRKAHSTRAPSEAPPGTCWSPSGETRAGHPWQTLRAGRLPSPPPGEFGLPWKSSSFPGSSSLWLQGTFPACRRRRRRRTAALPVICKSWQTNASLPRQTGMQNFGEGGSVASS